MTRFIKISEIPEEGCKISKQIPVSAIESCSEFEIAAPIILDVNIVKLKNGVVAKGLVKGPIKQACSLCLENFISEIRSSFELEFKSQLPESDKEEVELEREDMNVVYIKNSEIDLFEIVREQVFLSIPIKPVCKPKCLGLCPKCGSNLNTEKCNCQVETIDPRFSALKKLKIKKQ